MQQENKSITFADSVLIQANGDLSNKAFRAYMARRAQEEIIKQDRLPEKMTIETALAHIEKVKCLCDEIVSDYLASENDPENDAIGWRPTDSANEFLHMSSDQESAAREIVRLGMNL